MIPDVKREAVLAAVREGRTYVDIAAEFEISPSTICGWVEQDADDAIPVGISKRCGGSSGAIEVNDHGQVLNQKGRW
jgi:transposase-like protein